MFVVAWGGGGGGTVANDRCEWNQRLVTLNQTQENPARPTLTIFKLRAATERYMLQ